MPKHSLVAGRQEKKKVPGAASRAKITPRIWDGRGPVGKGREGGDESKRKDRSGRAKIESRNRRNCVQTGDAT